MQFFKRLFVTKAKTKKESLRSQDKELSLIENELTVTITDHVLSLPQNPDVPAPIFPLPNDTCRSYLTQGLQKFGQQEIFFSLALPPDKELSYFQSETFRLLKFIYDRAKEGMIVKAGSYTTFPEMGPFGVHGCNIAYLEAIHNSSLPGPKIPIGSLLATYIHPEETEHLLYGSPYRVAAWLAYQYRMFPYPKFSDPTRPSVIPRDLNDTTLKNVPTMHACANSMAYLANDDLLGGKWINLQLSDSDQSSLSNNLELISNQKSFAILAGHMNSASQRLVWLPNRENPEAVGFPTTEPCITELGFIAFVGDQKKNSMLYLEDGVAIFLTGYTWSNLIRGITSPAPWFNLALHFHDTTDISGLIINRASDDEGPIYFVDPIHDVYSDTINVLKKSLKQPDPIAYIKHQIEKLDTTLSRRIGEIIHHKDFQALERSWRGLHYLVKNSDTNELLKIRVFSISQKELWKTLKRYKGVLDQSPLFKKLHDDEFGVFGGEPYGCVIGDYYFDHQPQDVESLDLLAQIGAAIHAPFITGAAPSLFDCEEWVEWFNPHSLTHPDNQLGWAYLRKKESARFIALTMPRFLGRTPYKTTDKDGGSDVGFVFTEQVDATNSEHFCWLNSAYAMGVNINRSFSSYGWLARIRGIESGGAVENLPTYIFPASRGGVHDHCSVEFAMDERQEAEFANAGLMPLLQKNNSNFCAFIGASTLQKLPVPNDSDENAFNQILLARLPYLLSVCRIVHYLKCVNRDKLSFGAYKDDDYIERQLNEWLGQYTESDWNSPLFNTPQKPLAAGSVALSEHPSGFGSNVRLSVLPNYQLEALSDPVQVEFYLYRQ